MAVVATGVFSGCASSERQSPVSPAEWREYKAVESLIAKGADLNATTVAAEYNLSETALEWAKEGKRTEAVKLLTPVTESYKIRSQNPIKVYKARIP